MLDTCFVLRFREDVVVDGTGVDDAFGTCGDDSLINSLDGVESRDELSLLLELMVSTFLPLTPAETILRMGSSVGVTHWEEFLMFWLAKLIENCIQVRLVRTWNQQQLN